MSGVEPSSLVSVGSAPSSASSFISAASAVRAASRKGVAPIELSVVTPMPGRSGDARVELRALRHQRADELEAVQVARALGRRVVAAGDAGLAHPRHLMEGGVALRRGVGIRAAIEQPCGELVVRVARGEQERVRARLARPSAFRVRSSARRAHRQRVVHAWRRRQQRLHRGDAAVTRGEQQRREAPARTRCTSAPAATRARDHGRMAFGRRPHQRRLPAPALLGVRIRAVREQRLHGVHLAGARGHHQARSRPSGDAALASAPASISSAITAALPLTDASHSGVAP